MYVCMWKCKEKVIRDNDITLKQFLAIQPNSSAHTYIRPLHTYDTSLTTQIISDIEAMMSMEGSFKNYRQMLQTTTGPAIPYVGVTLQDLTFVDENPDRVTGVAATTTTANNKSANSPAHTTPSARTHINWSKQRMVHNIITDLLKFQANSDSFLSSPSSSSSLTPQQEEMVEHFLKSLPRYDEKELYRLSLSYEPRNAARADIK